MADPQLAVNPFTVTLIGSTEIGGPPVVEISEHTTAGADANAVANTTACEDTPVVTATVDAWVPAPDGERPDARLVSMAWTEANFCHSFAPGAKGSSSGLLTAFMEIPAFEHASHAAPCSLAHF